MARSAYLFICMMTAFMAHAIPPTQPTLSPAQAARIAAEQAARALIAERLAASGQQPGSAAQ